MLVSDAAASTATAAPAASAKPTSPSQAASQQARRRRARARQSRSHSSAAMPAGVALGLASVKLPPLPGGKKRKASYDGPGTLLPAASDVAAKRVKHESATAAAAKGNVPAGSSSGSDTDDVEVLDTSARGLNVWAGPVAGALSVQGSVCPSLPPARAAAPAASAKPMQAAELGIGARMQPVLAGAAQAMPGALQARRAHPSAGALPSNRAPGKRDAEQGATKQTSENSASVRGKAEAAGPPAAPLGAPSGQPRPEGVTARPAGSVAEPLHKQLAKLTADKSVLETKLCNEQQAVHALEQRIADANAELERERGANAQLRDRSAAHEEQLQKLADAAQAAQASAAAAQALADKARAGLQGAKVAENTAREALEELHTRLAHGLTGKVAACVSELKTILQVRSCSFWAWLSTNSMPRVRGAI